MAVLAEEYGYVAINFATVVIIAPLFVLDY